MPLISVTGLIPNWVDYSVHGSHGAASFPVNFYVVDSINFDVSISDECENLYAHIFHLPLQVEHMCTPPMHGPSAPVEGGPRSSLDGIINDHGYEHGEYSLSSNAYQFSAHGESGTSSVRYEQRDIWDDIPVHMAVRDPSAIDGTLGKGDFRHDGGLRHSAKPQDESGPSGKSKSFAALDYKGGRVCSRMLAYLETMELHIQSSTSSNDLVNDMSTPVLHSIARAHCIPLHSHIGILDLKKAVQEHFEECVCMVNEWMGTSTPPAPATPRTVPDSVSGGGMGDRKWLDEYLLHIDSVVKQLGQQVCKRIIAAHGLEGPCDSIHASRKLIRGYISELRKGKRQESYI
ncbi:hypothetical protein ARMGADRAFT_1029547 [Armillaria gallica]|uniref:Uncharacterized protein n=1 Tax=Armillaria gallica TaxID=47427 RepID=A0A2H3DGW1_ARMGA|nr:hypothetical protein ARMGADRAFT_1029547 [Armillaria gallica]